jgi:EAL and modified HD-GYP domain-containing signal transduction protein
MSPARFRHIDLMAAVAERDIDPARIITRDPALSFRLLRTAAAAVADGGQRPSSISEVIASLGPELARQWLALMLISEATEADEAQLEAVAAGAHFVQRVAEHLGEPGEPAFTAGMLAGLAELTGAPVAEIVEGLALVPEVRDAVRSGGGRLGAVLRLVRAYHDADMVGLRSAPVPAAELVRLYLNAAAWSTRTVAAVLAAVPGRGVRAAG